MPLETYDHDSFRTLLTVGAGYGLILAAILVLLFIVPYLLFLVL